MDFVGPVRSVFVDISFRIHAKSPSDPIHLHNVAEKLHDMTAKLKVLITDISETDLPFSRIYFIKHSVLYITYSITIYWPTELFLLIVPN